MSQDTVKVIFRVAHYNLEGEDGGTEVIAFFPEFPGTDKWWEDCTCYAHMGQHSTASIDFYQQATRPARPEEYASLKAELESIGYVLRVAERMTRHDQKKREEAVKAARGA